MTPAPSFLLGLDIGGTKSAAVVGDVSGMTLARVGGPTPSDWRAALAAFNGWLHEACARCGYAPANAVALGVSCGGPLDSKTGIVYSPPNLPGWDAVPLRALLEEAFSLPVQVENDANATALAEHRWGAGIGCQNMAFLTIGTGIGAGLILDGKLYRGRGDLAGEIGHATVWPDGPMCLCGKRGCLETLASGTAIGRMGRECFGETDITAFDVCVRARNGDLSARKILADAAHWMGVGLANLLQTLNLERIVLGTLAVHAGDLLLPAIRQETERYCWPRVWEGVQVLPAALGDVAQDQAALAVALLHSNLS